MFGNFGAMKAAAMARRNNNQQPQQGGMGSMVSNAINNVRIGRTNKGTVPGNPSIPVVPGGMMASIMRGRNVANQNQLTSTPINPSAFNTNVTGQVFNQNQVDPLLNGNAPLTQKKSSPLKQDINNSVDPLTGQYIDPTMSQGLDSGTVDPMLDQDATSLTQY